MWRLASTYMPYLSQHFRDILSLHQKEMAGEQFSLLCRQIFFKVCVFMHKMRIMFLGIKESFDRWEMCTATLQKFMGFALTSLSQRATNNSDNVKTVVNL